MCQKIIGTEELVQTRRKMNAVRDNLSSNETSSFFTSGSFGEGLEMRGSDVDIMTTIEDTEVSEDRNVHFDPVKTYFIMETDEAPLGFTQLRLIHSDSLSTLYFCDKIGGEYYLSNVYVKQLLMTKNTPIVHGPCISDTWGLLDIACCLHSKNWISQAAQWITRSNNSWPAYDVKQSIIQHGVLFVPKGVQGSIKEDLEWRISFSVGEKFLVYTFTHSQLLCYALMKIILKDVIDTDLDCKELLCSYFLKTILFWISEEMPHTIWKPACMIPNFMRYFRRLIYCVENSVCPHYFIPENNLFAIKIRGHAQETLLQKLITLNSYGWQCILFSDQINKSALQINSEMMSINAFNDKSLKFIVSYFGYGTDALIISLPFSLIKVVQRILSFESSKIKHLYSLYMSNICRYNVQSLPFVSTYTNKSSYKQYKACISTCLLSTHHDAVSGWLMTASFFYKTRQYKIALEILHYSLRKCSPKKLYHEIDLSDIHYELISLHMFKQMSIVQLTKLLLVKEVRLIKNSYFTPDEFKIADNTKHYRIPPVVYIHSLRFLCHYHLNNIIQCRHSLIDLQITIDKELFISNVAQKAESLHILGIIFQLVGDKKSARQACLKAVKLFPDKDCNKAFRFLSLAN